MFELVKIFLFLAIILYIFLVSNIVIDNVHYMKVRKIYERKKLKEVVLQKKLWTFYKTNSVAMEVILNTVLISIV